MCTSCNMPMSTPYIYIYIQAVHVHTLHKAHTSQCFFGLATHLKDFIHVEL